MSNLSQWREGAATEKAYPVNADKRTTGPRISYLQPGDRSARSAIVNVIESLSGRSKLEDIYRQLKTDRAVSSAIFGDALDLAGIRYSITQSGHVRPPSSGPLVLVANHPFGIVDGLMLCDIAHQLRGDFRILINALLCRDEDLQRFFLPIDFSSSKSATVNNIRSKQQAMGVLQSGGVVLVFPGGGISTRRRQGFGRLDDLPWTTFCAKLIQHSKATVVPVFFHGSNSRLFHIASGVSETLRASLILHEARNKLGRRFRVTLGDAITAERMANHSRRSLTEFLYQQTWNLGGL